MEINTTNKDYEKASELLNKVPDLTIENFDPILVEKVVEDTVNEWADSKKTWQRFERNMAIAFKNENVRKQVQDILTKEGFDDQ
jgi:hypothetical protein